MPTSEPAAEATGVSFTSDSMRVELSNGHAVTVPLSLFPRLLSATQAQREAFRIRRRGIHWPELDEDISIAGILAAE